MAKIIAEGNLAGAAGTFVYIHIPEKYTGKVGIMLSGDFDTGYIQMLAGVTDNRQTIGNINPETAARTARTANSAGLYYMEVFCDALDFRTLLGAGNFNVDYTVFIGDRP